MIVSCIRNQFKAHPVDTKVFSVPSLPVKKELKVTKVEPFRLTEPSKKEVRWKIVFKQFSYLFIFFNSFSFYLRMLLQLIMKEMSTISMLSQLQSLKYPTNRPSLSVLQFLERPNFLKLGRLLCILGVDLALE